MVFRQISQLWLTSNQFLCLYKFHRTKADESLSNKHRLCVCLFITCLWYCILPLCQECPGAAIMPAWRRQGKVRTGEVTACVSLQGVRLVGSATNAVVPWSPLWVPRLHHVLSGEEVRNTRIQGSYFPSGFLHINQKEENGTQDEQDAV